MQGHVAALLILLGEVARENWSLISVYVPLITDLAVKKWFAQTFQLQEFFVSTHTIFFSLQKNNYCCFSVENCK